MRNNQTHPQVASQVVVAGVDTHQKTHHVAVLDDRGRLLADKEFPVNEAGYRALTAWASEYGTVQAYGVESTGAYGAGLTRHLLLADLEVYEVNRPDKTTRARDGKSDPIDAEAAARAVLHGTATGRPKIKTGIVEAIRTIKITRDSAVQHRTKVANQIRDLATTAPGTIHDELIGLTTRARVKRAAGYRPDLARIDDPTQATKYALRTLARRFQVVDEEITEADRELDELTARAVPTLRAMPQVGVQTAAQLVITAGQNIDRMANEASFAKLTGTAPLPASSGKKSHRHRLNRGGDRQANSALHMIAVGRLKTHAESRAYRDRRQADGLNTPDILRCLKRHLCRSVYRALRDDLMTA